MSIKQVVSNENFQQIIDNNPYVLMEFYASWCPHCQAFYPTLEAASTKLNQEGIVVAQTEIDTFEQLANEYNVQSIPTLFFFKNGQEVLESVGGRDEQGVYQFASEGMNA